MDPRGVRAAATWGLLALAAVAVSACGPVGPPPSTAAVPPRPGPVGGGASPAPIPAPDGTPLFALPDRVGAYDVGGGGRGDFASPTGRIRCSLAADGVRCELPTGFMGRVPMSGSACPGAPAGALVDAVALDASGGRFTCLPGAGGSPVKGSPTTAWMVAGDGLWANPDGRGEVATLSYGAKLVSGDYVCAMAETGVTCAHLPSGHAVWVRRAGVDFS